MKFYFPLKLAEIIYYQDPYIQELESEIVFSRNINNYYLLKFRENLFYPGGGGQPADRGMVGNQPVEKIEEENGEVLVYVKELPPESRVCLKVDFNWRYDFMQQHTAQHLLSQVILRLFNFQTLSFSMFEDHSAIELNCPEISEIQIRQVEEECFRQIQKNLDIKIHYDVFINEGDKLKSSFQLRKPPKVSENVRVVEIDGYDFSACGGLHVRSLCELGLVKIVKVDKVRRNVRLYYVAGRRALLDYQQTRETLMKSCNLFCCSPNDFFGLLENSMKNFKEESLKSRKIILELYQRIIEQEIRKEPILYLEINFAGEIAKKLGSWALEKGFQLILDDKQAKRFLIASALLKEQPDLQKSVLEIINGRGGGRGGILEGSYSQELPVQKLLHFWKENF